MALGITKKKISLQQTVRIFALLIIITTIAALYHRMLLVTQCSFTLDPLLTNEMHFAIQSFVEKNSWRSDPHALTQKLSDAFPCIKTVATHVMPPSLLHITVIAETPALAVNNSHIITQNGKIVPDNCFLRHRIISLPVIRMRHLPTDTPLLSHELRICLAHLTPTMLTSYAITIENETSILLHDMYAPTDILCCAANMPDQTILAQCKHIVQSLASQETSQQITHRNRWIADIRFHKQIIVSQKGGI